MVGAVQGIKGDAQDVEFVGTQMGSRSKRLQILEVEIFKAKHGWLCQFHFGGTMGVGLRMLAHSHM
jgi:hypothetical protein